MSHPKRADHFKKWSQMMLEQALVPERLEYKGTSSMKRPSRGGKRKRRLRAKRFLRRKRHKQQE